MTPRRRWALPLAVALTAAVAAPLGAIGWRSLGPPSAPAAAAHAHPAAERYQCPMHPAVIQDTPGTCPICGMKLVKVLAPTAAPRAPRFYRSPMDARRTSPVPMKDEMGMDYLPVYDDDAPPRSEVDGLAAVELDPRRQQLIGLRTAEVDRGPVGAAVRAAARVGVDETRVRRVNVKTPGYVERLFVDFVGKPVRKGQPLFSLYSPEVLAAEGELAAALKGGGALAGAARRKLELLDVPEAELQRLEAGGAPARTVTFTSPVTGVVTRKDVVEGARLEAGAMPFEVVDLSTVWVLAEVYERELRFVTPGARATLSLSAHPGRTWTGAVRFIDPVLNPLTRTARVRLAFDNPDGELRPELFGEVVLERALREVTRAPKDAVIHDGELAVVFVALDHGRLSPRRVILGERGREFVEVLEGLEAGERVVTRAAFLVDSESKLRASLARLGAAAEPPR